MKIQKQIPTVLPVRTAGKIVFGFSELRKFSYCDSRSNDGFFVDFLDRLKKLSSMRWVDADKSARHSFGWEKILVESMKQSARNLLTKEVKHLIAFRATGSNHVFLGYREGDTFQVIFIEKSFGDVYNHG